MKNTGTPPDRDYVDILFRNGQVRRRVDPKKWRWKPWDRATDFDITDWQECR